MTRTVAHHWNPCGPRRSYITPPHEDFILVRYSLTGLVGWRDTTLLVFMTTPAAVSSDAATSEASAQCTAEADGAVTCTALISPGDDSPRLVFGSLGPVLNFTAAPGSGISVRQRLHRAQGVLAPCDLCVCGVPRVPQSPVTQFQLGGQLDGSGTATDSSSVGLGVTFNASPDTANEWAG